MGSVLLSSSSCCYSREENIDSQNIIPRGRREGKGNSDINKSIRVISILRIYNKFTIKHKQEERRILDP